MKHLHTLRSMSASGTELQFYWQLQEGQPMIFMRTHQPRQPQVAPHEARTTIPEFQTLTNAIQDGLPARPTLDFTGGNVNLHLTTRSRRPGRLSIRSDQHEVLNFSTLTPIHEEFQRVLDLALELTRTTSV